MRITEQIVATLLILLYAATGSAQSGGTYYVAETGSDTPGGGSSATPWATIEYAVTSVPDDSLVLVRPGTYHGRVRLDAVFSNGITVRSSQLYQARLRHTGTVVTCYYGQGITLEGFDIAHSGPGSDALVIQIQDLIGPPGGSDRVSRIVIRGNVLHDSYNNDILKINNGAEHVLVEGNIFYNQEGSDEHIDINSVSDIVVQDNVFFNDFAGSGRTNANDTSSFIVVKDSNGDSDGIEGSERITVRRNVFLNWEGSTGSNFVLLGEDGNSYYEAHDVLVENNLMLGNSGNTMRAPFGVKGCRDAVFRANTVVGDLPSYAFAMRLNTEGANLPNDGIDFHNNVWSDPTGTMGAHSGGSNDFSDTPIGETLTWILDRNLYFNGGVAIPEDPGELINSTDDVTRVVADPQLPPLTGLILPRWEPLTGFFADGSTEIPQVKRRLVDLYGTPAAGSPIIDAADPASCPAEDILGQSRTGGLGPDLGCLETGVGLVFADGFETGDTQRWDSP
jgi:hypothetical protein